MQRRIYEFNLQVRPMRVHCLFNPRNVNPHQRESLKSRLPLVFDTIAGLPVHILVVHVAVVLIPLSAIGATLIAARPKALRLFGAATVIGATVGVIASVIAEFSGNQLAGRVGWSEEHANYGDVFPIAAVAFLALLIVFWLIARGVPLNRHRPLWLKVIGAILIVASIGITYFTVLTGYSGSKATWSEIVEKSQPGTFAPE